MRSARAGTQRIATVGINHLLWDTSVLDLPMRAVRHDKREIGRPMNRSPSTSPRRMSRASSRSAMRSRYPRQVWRNPAGKSVIESYTIPAMAHGTPLATGSSDEHVGVPGAFLLDVGISSSYHIAKFWGLTGHTRAVPIRQSESASIVPARRRQDRATAETSGEPIGDAHEPMRSEEHTSELQSRQYLVCR